MHVVVGITGDGIGPEIFECAKQVLAATGVPINWEIMPAGEGALPQFGTPLPNITIEAIHTHRICLKGPLTTPDGKGYTSPNVALRKHFDLYANVRPAELFPGVQGLVTHPFRVVIFRENVEELYAGTSMCIGEKGNRVAVATYYVTEAGCRRIAHAAFRFARDHGLRNVLVVHKANILKDAHGLFLDVSQEVAREYPMIRFAERRADVFPGKFVENPCEHDVLLMPNLFGDIFSDLAAHLAGGLGFASGMNMGDTHVIFEAVHGTAPDRAGTDSANPVSIILAGARMLDSLKETKAAERIWQGVRATAMEWAQWSDGSGVKSTRAVTDRIIALMPD